MKRNNVVAARRAVQGEATEGLEEEASPKAARIQLAAVTKYVKLISVNVMMEPTLSTALKEAALERHRQAGGGRINTPAPSCAKRFGSIPRWRGSSTSRNRDTPFHLRARKDTRAGARRAPQYPGGRTAAHAAADADGRPPTHPTRHTPASADSGAAGRTPRRRRLDAYPYTRLTPHPQRAQHARRHHSEYVRTPLPDFDVDAQEGAPVDASLRA